MSFCLDSPEWSPVAPTATAAISQGDERPTFSKLLTHSSGFGILPVLVKIENCLNRDLSSS